MRFKILFLVIIIITAILVFTLYKQSGVPTYVSVPYGQVRLIGTVQETRQVAIGSQDYIDSYINWQFREINNTHWTADFSFTEPFFSDLRRCLNNPSDTACWEYIQNTYLPDYNLNEIRNDLLNLTNYPLRNLTAGISFSNFQIDLTSGTGSFYIVFPNGFKEGEYAELGFGTTSLGTTTTLLPFDAYVRDVCRTTNRIHAVWSTSTRISYTNSSDGVTWNTAINLDGSSTIDDEDNVGTTSPSISCSGNRVFVAWINATASPSGLYYMNSTDEGGTWSSYINNMAPLWLTAGGTNFFNSVGGVSFGNNDNVWVTYNNDTGNVEQIWISNSTSYGGDLPTLTMKQLTGDWGIGYASIYVNVTNGNEGIWVATSSATDNDLYFNWSTNGGSTWSGSKIATGSYTKPSLTLFNGTFYVVNEEFGAAGMNIRIWNTTNPATSPWGNATIYTATATTDDARIPMVTNTSNNLYVFFPKENGIDNTYDLWYQYWNITNDWTSAILFDKTGSGITVQKISINSMNGTAVDVLFANQTGTDTVYYGVVVEIIDMSPPTWSNNATNSTAAGTWINHSVVLSDNNGLSWYNFEFDNGTGSLNNISTIDISGASMIANQTVLINSTIGATIRWRYYFNDTSNNWNSTDLFSYATSEGTPPTWSNNAINSTAAGTWINHSVVLSDNNGLSWYNFEFDNGTGSLNNITNMSISGLSVTANQTVLINSTSGSTIRWRYYFNDTYNNWNVTDLFSYTASRIITVCSSGCDSTTIQGGINLASNSDTVLIIDNGWYNENVALNKSITLSSNSTVRPTINSTGTTLRITANSATVTNLTIAYNGTNINQNTVWITGNYTTIANNTIGMRNQDRNSPVYVQNSANNTIYGNNITAQSWSAHAVYITGSVSTNNTIDSNIISYGATSSFGIRVDANNNTIRNNNITSSGGYSPVYMNAYYSTMVVENNYVNDRPIVYNKTLQNLTMEVTSYGQLILANSFNVTINNSQFTESGIMFLSTTNSTIINSNITTKTEAINLVAGNNYNTIFNNNISTSGGDRSYGIYLNSGNYNNISNNNITTTGNTYSHGMYVITDNNTIERNTIKILGTTYGGNGITITSGSWDNKITIVNITTGGGPRTKGIQVAGSNNNITSCNITTTGSSSTFTDTGGDIVALPSAIHIQGGNNNRISDCILDATNYYDIFISGTSSQKNYLINSTFNKTDIMFNASSNTKLYNQYYLDVYVNDSSGSPIDSATVVENDTDSVDNIENPTSNFTTTTNTSGYIPQQILTEFMGNWTYNSTNGYLYFSNYTINASKSGYTDGSNQVNLTSSRTEVVTLTNTVPPTWSNNQTNSTAEWVNHSVVLSDDAGLSWYNFEFDNGTGTLTNITNMSISGLSVTANQTVLVNSTSGSTIRWRYYFNDSGNNWNRTDLFNYTVSNSPPTIVNQQSYVNWTTSSGFNITATATDINGLTDISNCTLFHRRQFDTIWWNITNNKTGVYNSANGNCTSNVSTSDRNQIVWSRDIYTGTVGVQLIVANETEGVVYVVDDSNGVYKINATNGTVIDSTDFGGYGASGLSQDADFLYFGEDQGNRLFRVNKTFGGMSAASDLGSDGNKESTSVDAGFVYVGDRVYNLTKVNKTNFTDVKWQVNFGATGRIYDIDNNQTGDWVYTCDSYNIIKKINKTDNATSWSVDKGANACYSIKLDLYDTNGTTNLLWMGDENYILYLINETDGSTIWSRDFGAGVIYDISVDDDFVYTFDNTGNVMKINKTDKSSVWNFTMSSEVWGGGDIDTSYIYTYDGNNAQVLKLTKDFGNYTALENITTKMRFNDTFNAMVETTEAWNIMPDFVPPTWSNNQSSYPSQYSPALSMFNITWNDNAQVSTILIEINYSGAANYTMTKFANNIYNFNITLPAGSFYWKSYANDTSNNWNVSDTWNFTINQNQTNPINIFFINSTGTYQNQNITIDYGESITANATMVYSNAGTASLFEDNSSVVNPRTVTLSAGNHSYKGNTSGNTNYTANGTGATYYITVNPVAYAISINLNATQVWWNDSVNLSGYATSTGSPFSGWIQVNRSNDTTIMCNTTTSNGYYSCVFYAPPEISNYNYTSYMLSQTGSALVGNSTILTVMLSYGSEYPGKNVGVYEAPVIIQEMSGKIKIVWVKIKTWFNR